MVQSSFLINSDNIMDTFTFLCNHCVSWFLFFIYEGQTRRSDGEHIIANHNRFLQIYKTSYIFIDNSGRVWCFIERHWLLANNLNSCRTYFNSDYGKS